MRRSLIDDKPIVWNRINDLPAHIARAIYGIYPSFAVGNCSDDLEVQNGEGFRGDMARSLGAWRNFQYREFESRRDATRLTPPEPANHPLTILFRPDPYIWDGRYANNPWLQELPRLLTKLTWDNPLLISPALAKQSKLQNMDIVRVSTGDECLEAPVWIMPGQAPDCVVALLGFGRTRVGAIGNGAGFNFYPLKDDAYAPSLEKGAGRMQLACTEHHNLIFSQPNEAVRHGTLADYLEDPKFLSASKSEKRCRSTLTFLPVSMG